MKRIAFFAGIAMALVLCLGFAPWRSLMSQPHELGPALAMAGGLFTIAIAVLIRD